MTSPPTPAQAPHAEPPSPAYVGKVLTATSVAVGLLVLLMLLWLAREVVLLMFAGLLIAVLLRGAGMYLSRATALGDRTAVAIVLVVGLAAAGMTGWLVGPGIVVEVKQLQAGMIQSVEDLRSEWADTRTGQLVARHMPDINEDDYQAIWTRIGGISATALGAIGSLMIVLFVGIFFAFNPGLYVSGMLRLLPIPRRARALQVMEALGTTLRWWLIGQLISMLVLWLSTWLMLWLLGVPLAFILGLLTGLLTFVPYIGPIIALIPIALVAFMESPTLAVTVIAFYLVIQNIEANLLMPLVFQRLVHLPPALTLASQILMATLVGALGVVLATPLLAVVMVLVAKLYVEDVLGDSMEQPSIETPADPADYLGIPGD
jgi:predicted PurR-regulated permease PerM